MQDQITEKDCPYCTWSGPSNSFSAHLAECPNIDHSTGSVRENPRDDAQLVADGGRRLQARDVRGDPVDGGRLSPGDRVADRDDDCDYPSHAVVLETVTASAEDYPIAALDGQTVAELNPEYPADADVVLVAFANDLDELLPGWEDYTLRQLRKHTVQTDLSVYAYPAPRLRRLETDDEAADPGGDVHV